MSDYENQQQSLPLFDEGAEVQQPKKLLLKRAGEEKDQDSKPLILKKAPIKELSEQETLMDLDIDALNQAHESDDDSELIPAVSQKNTENEARLEDTENEARLEDTENDFLEDTPAPPAPRKIILKKAPASPLSSTPPPSSEHLKENIPSITLQPQPMPENALETESAQNTAPVEISPPEIPQASLKIQSFATETELFEDDLHQDEVHPLGEEETLCDEEGEYNLEGDGLPALLSNTRRRRKITVQELSQRTKVKKDLILALEEGHYKICPEAVYMKNNLKTICEELGLNPVDAYQMYCSESGTIDAISTHNSVTYGSSGVSQKGSFFINKFLVLGTIVLILFIAAAGFTSKYLLDSKAQLAADDVLDVELLIEEKTLPKDISLPLPPVQ